jgi:fumarylacetoacetase
MKRNDMSLMQSWVGSANSATCPYPLNNLPCGVFSVGATDAEPHCGMAIGDFVLDVTALEGC